MTTICKKLLSVAIKLQENQKNLETNCDSEKLALLTKNSLIKKVKKPKKHEYSFNLSYELFKKKKEIL